MKMNMFAIAEIVGVVPDKILRESTAVPLLYWAVIIALAVASLCGFLVFLTHHGKHRPYVVFSLSLLMVCVYSIFSQYLGVDAVALHRFPLDKVFHGCLFIPFAAGFRVFGLLCLLLVLILVQAVVFKIASKYPYFKDYKMGLIHLVFWGIMFFLLITIYLWVGVFTM